VKNNNNSVFETKIYKYDFDFSSLKKIKSNSKLINWPTVYILSNNKEAYIGETLSVDKRIEQHLKNKKRKNLKTVNLIVNDSFNKSAILDIENMLIEYFHADNKYSLQNENFGQSKLHNYYQRGFYQNSFYEIWDKLRKKKIVNSTAFQIQNSDIFKFSPYKCLTNEQFDISMSLLSDIASLIEAKKSENKKGNIMINGVAGTGKTVMAISLIKFIIDLINKPIDYSNIIEDFNEDNLSSNFQINKIIKQYANEFGLKIGFVIPVPSFRTTIKKVFSITKGLKANMVLSPSQAAKGNYDIIFVDEAHRLKRRAKLTNYGSHDHINKMMGLDRNADELDWILNSANLATILFYDKHQSVKISDVKSAKFDMLRNMSKSYDLSNQLRIKAGKEYIDFWNAILNNNQSQVISPNTNNYDFKIFDDLEKMFDNIKEKNIEFKGLCRVLSGYSFPWRHHIRDNSNTKYTKEYDFIIDGKKYTWNTTVNDWLTRKDSINEVGCIYTCQGYDLNYAGVILGPDIFFNEKTGKIDFNIDKYYDTYSKDKKNIEQTKKNIINAYLVLLTRGIYGTYVYVWDSNLRNYLKEKFGINK